MSAVRLWLPIRDHRFSLCFFPGYFCHLTRQSPRHRQRQFLHNRLHPNQFLLPILVGGEPFKCFRCPKTARHRMIHTYNIIWHTISTILDMSRQLLDCRFSSLSVCVYLCVGFFVDFGIFDKCELCRLRITYFPVNS